MATKVKPCRIKATGTPQAGYVPKYVDEDTFQWGAGGGGGGSDIEYVTQAEYEALLPGALTDGKHYFIYTSSTPPTPTPPFTPGANTIAYRPLTEDANDQLGNYNGTIEGTALTFGTAGGSTIDSAFFSNTRMTTTLTGAWKTLNLWVYKPSTSNDPSINNRKQIAGNMNTAGNSGVMVRSEQSNNSNGKFFINLGNGDFNYAYGKDTDQWINLCLITNGSNSTKLYINGVERITTSSTRGTNSTFWLGTAPFNSVSGGDLSYCWWGNISNVIIESVERSAQEISDYFDLTKGDYGIS